MLSALLLLGISSVATAPLEEGYADDGEGEDDNGDLSDFEVRKPVEQLWLDRNSAGDGFDAPGTTHQMPSIGSTQTTGSAPGPPNWRAFAGDVTVRFESEGISQPNDLSNIEQVHVFPDQPHTSREVSAQEGAGTDAEASSQGEGEEQSGDADEGEPQPLSDTDAAGATTGETPGSQLFTFDGPATTRETFLVGNGEGAEPFADIAEFIRGEHILDVTVYADPTLESVDMEVRTSADGKSSILTANGKILTVLRGVPDADLEDFNITVQWTWA